MSLKRLFSHFVTPSFSPEDRARWARALSLEKAPFFFLEMSGSLPLQCLRIAGAECFPLLSQNEVGTCPQWKLTHTGSALTIAPAWPEGGLWENLFPYPSQLLPLLVRGNKETTLSISPFGAGEAWKELYYAFLKLEQRLGDTEISCLWVRTPEGQPSLPLLTHFVRRRCLRVGTAPHLYELGEKYERAELTSEVLSQHFGTRAAFFALDLAHPPSESSETAVLGWLSQAFRATADKPEWAVAPPPLFDLESEFRL